MENWKLFLNNCLAISDGNVGKSEDGAGRDMIIQVDRVRLREGTGVVSCLKSSLLELLALAQISVYPVNGENALHQSMEWKLCQFANIYFSAA